MNNLGTFSGIKIMEVDARLLPVIGHRIALPDIATRGDRRRVKRWCRKVKASAKPIHASYLIDPKAFDLLPMEELKVEVDYKPYSHQFLLAGDLRLYRAFRCTSI